MRRRSVLVAVAVVGLAAGAGGALLLAGGDDDAAEPTTVVDTPATTEAAPPTTPTSTATAPEPPPPEVLTQPDQRQIARTVSSLIEAVELGDGEDFCRIVARSSGQAEGIEALQACARQVGIDPFGLPSSDELSIATVKVRGSRATARLDGGGSFTLARRGKGWIVRSYSSRR